MFTHLLRLVEGNDEGATAVEYAIMAGFIAAVIAFAVSWAMPTWMHCLSYTKAAYLPLLICVVIGSRKRGQ